MKNKKEPIKYSMSTGLPVEDNIKKYPLESAEQSFLKFIENQKESRKLYQERLEKIREENKDSG